MVRTRAEAGGGKSGPCGESFLGRPGDSVGMEASPSDVALLAAVGQRDLDALFPPLKTRCCCRSSRAKVHLRAEGLS